MSTYTSEPGTRLAGRYRLVEQVAAGNGWTNWKAVDETLARPVAVLTFAPGFPRVAQVVTAARAASRLTDPRMAQVFDVEDGNGQSYVVLEWVGGESLTDLLDAGPLDPARACALIGDAARALAGAHAVGQAHLRLTPDALRWTRSSGIKITGLGIDAALAGDGLTGTAAHDPATADTIALAGLLYAALTGYWPGDQPTRLPAAPVSDGAVCTLRQVSANVSAAIDSVVTRALLQRPTRQGPPIQSTGAFADALGEVAPPVPLPEPAPPAPSGYGDRGSYDGYGGGYGPDSGGPASWSDRGMGGTAPYPQRGPAAQFAGDGAGYRGSGYPPRPYPGTERGGMSRVMLAVVVALVLAGIAVTVWAVGLRGSGGPSQTAAGGSHPTTSHSASPKTPTGTVLTPAGVSTFNIFGSDNEDASQAPNAIDGKTGTYWGTDQYKNYPKFGNLKPGTGLLIDMGKKVRLSQVAVTFGTQGPMTAEIYLGNSKAMSTTALQNFTPVGHRATGTGLVTYRISSHATGRYVLIWLTGSLPAVPGQPNMYQGRIYNVAVRGTAVSGTS